MTLFLPILGYFDTLCILRNYEKLDFVLFAFTFTCLGCDFIMKVLHFISGGDTGGAKTHVLTLLKRLREIGIEAELLCIMEGVFTKDAEKLNIPVHIIPQKKRYDIAVIRKIREFINSSEWDIVHCHGARANYIASFIRKKVSVPMVTTLHSDYKLDFRDTWYKQFVFTPINYFALRRFKHILAVTQSFKNMLIERGFDKKRIFVIYNGINFDNKPAVIDKKTFFENYSLEYDPQKIYVGIAARLNVVKGVINFLKAAKDICSENNNIIFLIAGTGDSFNEYTEFIRKNNISERVFMLGHVNDIDSFFNAVDINTLTSLSESFPYSLLEGARMKKPTVSTAVGGIVEMIENEKSGILVPSGDITALKNAILSLADSEELREKFGNAFYKRAFSLFSDRQMAKRHSEIYEKIVKENAK